MSGKPKGKRVEKISFIAEVLEGEDNTREVAIPEDVVAKAGIEEGDFVTLTIKEVRRSDHVRESP